MYRGAAGQRVSPSSQVNRWDPHHTRSPDPTLGRPRGGKSGREAPGTKLSQSYRNPLNPNSYGKAYRSGFTSGHPQGPYLYHRIAGGVMFYRVKRVKGRYYLVKEWWDPGLKRKITKSIGSCEWLEGLSEEHKREKGGSRGGAPRVVPRPGFEPGSRARKARILGRAILPRPPQLVLSTSGVYN